MSSRFPAPASPTAAWQLLPGRADAALGVTLAPGGANLVVFAEGATALWWCLFDADGGAEQRLPLHGPTPEGLWHGFVPGAGPGLIYGLRADGPHAPERGQRFNRHKLLLEPCAQQLVGRFEWLPEHHGYPLGEAVSMLDTRDNAAPMLQARIAAPLPPMQSPRPRVPREHVVLYEVHTKGFSQQHPSITPERRGSYAALASPEVIAHFKALGVTTLSLLPVFYRLNEPMLPEGMVNFWGYNTLAFFCPDPRLAGAAAATANDTEAATHQFRAMVETLHAAGLEVVLDVVFNHTPEGNEWGPTLCFRGLGEAAWYWREAAEGGAGGTRLANWSGCGNTVQVAHPQVMRFVVQALRHWVQVMGVDGFRFDLAPVLGRHGASGAFDTHAPFFRALQQDPVLSQVHLIAEPWDSGPGGYGVGRFPPPWAEWNDHFRDAVRAFWLGAPSSSRAALAEAFCGSPATYRGAGRAPTASVNFITAHDGFTLADVVSHAHKHNEANGEGNRDGRDNELCANFGHEGPCADAAINATRSAVQRALLATLLLAHGTPMLLAGDELGNSQGGNNNAWNQDNTTGWLDWSAAEAPQKLGLAAFIGQVLALRREHAAFRPADWPAQPPRWLNLAEPAQSLAVLLAGGEWLLAFNPSAQPLPLAAPGRWARVLDSRAGGPATGAAEEHFLIPARCLQAWRRQPHPPSATSALST